MTCLIETKVLVLILMFMVKLLCKLMSKGLTICLRQVWRVWPSNASMICDD